jgi:hypothetical protein
LTRALHSAFGRAAPATDGSVDAPINTISSFTTKRKKKTLINKKLFSFYEAKKNNICSAKGRKQRL